jgi:microtubule-associated protein-like 6
MWPPGRDLTDVNAACTSRDQSVSWQGLEFFPFLPLNHHFPQVIATADDFALVKLFDFPCPGKNAKCKKYTGHSSHVTNVRFAANDKYLVSTGGSDTATMVWQFHGEQRVWGRRAREENGS